MILALLQARVSSSRLPEKVLKPILGTPMLFRQIERVRQSESIDQLVVVTSTDPSDDPLEELCREHRVDWFRGSLRDVLDRFYRASQKFPADRIVRLTGDCPLADPKLIDRVVQFHKKGNYDYTSNALEPTYPDGLDVEVFQREALEAAWREAQLSSEREHVTPFLYKHPERFRLGNFKNREDLSFLRWTVDEPSDLNLVTRIYEALYPLNSSFTTEEILGFLDQNPSLKTLNTRHSRNEGLQKSLQQDLLHSQK